MVLVCPTVSLILLERYLLNAAEALNEAKGPEAAYDYVNQVRARVGMHTAPLRMFPPSRRNASLPTQR